MAAPTSHSPGTPEAAPDIIMSHSDGLPSISAVRMPQPGDGVVSPRLIGQPVTFSSGPFAGQTVRAELCEIQKADAGRKFYAKDRRPLDPPPTAQLRLFVVSDDASEQEVEDYATVQAEGWMCHISMFRVVASVLQDNEAASNPSTVLPDTVGPSDLTTPHKSTPSSPISSPSGSPQPLGSNVTNELMGTTFVQALKPSINGRPILVFPFIDVASKIEGDLCLRYQVFDLFHAVQGHGIPDPIGPKPIIAECVGGPFKVYNSKTFPGLIEVTALTKSLEDVGVFTGKRAAVRKRQQNKPNGTS